MMKTKIYSPFVPSLQYKVVIHSGLERRVDFLLREHLSLKPWNIGSMPRVSFSRSSSCGSIATDDGLFEQQELQTSTSAVMDKIIKRRSLLLRSQQQAWQKCNRFSADLFEIDFERFQFYGIEQVTNGICLDAAPFKQWYLQYYGLDVGRKKKNTSAKKGEEAEAVAEEAKKSNHVVRKTESRQQDHKLDPHIEEQFSGGRLLASISSRPGQCGRVDGYILEGKELEFYMKKLQKKKGKGAA